MECPKGFSRVIEKYQSFPRYMRYSQLTHAEKYNFIREFLSYLSKNDCAEVVLEALGNHQEFFLSLLRVICDGQKKPEELFDVVLECVNQYMEDSFSAWFKELAQEREEADEEYQKIYYSTPIEERHCL